MNTPPPELVEQWATEYYGQPVRLPNRHSGKYIATKSADWQLEQVIEWIEKKRGGSIKLHNSEINNLIIDLKKAMRPQENN